jgi:hypothetical protein
MDDEQDDRRVARRSNDECRRIAQRTKGYFGIGRTWPVNVARVLRSGKVLTVRGEKPLIYNVVDNHVLGIKDAKTEVVNGSIVVTVKQAIDSLMAWGDCRSRMTLAHELGHVVMHAEEGSIDHRAAGSAGTTTLSKTNASESAEHQAKVFASAFLIDEPRSIVLSSTAASLAAFNDRSLPLRRYQHARIDGEVASTERLTAQNCTVHFSTDPTTPDQYPIGPDFLLDLRVSIAPWRAYTGILLGILGAASMILGGVLARDTFVFGAILVMLGAFLVVLSYNRLTGKIKFPGAK